MEEWGLTLAALLFLLVLIIIIFGYNPDRKPSTWTNYNNSISLDNFSDSNDNHSSFESDNSNAYDGDSPGGDSSGGDGD